MREHGSVCTVRPRASGNWVRPASGMSVPGQAAIARKLLACQRAVGIDAPIDGNTIRDPQRRKRFIRALVARKGRGRPKRPVVRAKARRVPVAPTMTPAARQARLLGLMPPVTPSPRPAPPFLARHILEATYTGPRKFARPNI